MKLTIFNPWNWFKHEDTERALSGQMFDKVFSNYGLPSLFGNSNPVGNAFFRPQVDVSASEKDYEIVLDVPGMKEDELAIEVQGESLVIRGEKREDKETKDKHFYRVERSYGTFQRTLALPDDANAEEISAKLKDGVLTLNILRNKVPENKNTRRIAIS